MSEGITYPVLMDRDHITSELLAISNVPTVLWVDEDNRIVRPNAPEMGTDTFIEFTKRSCEGHLDAIRRWVRTGELPLTPEEARGAVTDLSEDEITARLHFRLAKHLQRSGDEAAAEKHFDRAVELAPVDFTIVRASLPLRGEDPFGQRFFDIFEEWQAAGSPYHGVAPLTPAGD